MNKTLVIIIIIAIVLVGGYLLFRGTSEAPVPGPAPEVAPITAEEKVPPAGEPSTSQDVKEFTVTGTEYSLSPSSITLKAGQKVKITFQNNGRVIHNLVLEGLGIETKTISAGKTDTLEFTAPSSGTYTFFCSVSGHRAAGMAGNLIVE